MPKTKAEQSAEIKKDTAKFVANGGEIKAYDEKGNFVPKVKKHITLPLIKPQIDKPVYIQITSAMFIGKAVKKAGEGTNMEPATLVNCLDLETGAESQIIVPAVLKSILKDEYPSDSYINKGFMLTKRAKVTGKPYHNFDVSELEL